MPLIGSPSNALGCSMAQHTRWNVRTNARGQHPPDTYDPVLSLVSNPQRLQVPTRQTDIDRARGSPPRPRPREPLRPSKTAGQQPYRGVTCSYLCGEVGC
jgi:hypothetical protein